MEIHEMPEVTDEIKPVRVFSKDVSDPAGLVICPHCDTYTAIEWPCRGEQYKHHCGGWFDVTSGAKFIRAAREDDADVIEKRLREATPCDGAKWAEGGGLMRCTMKPGHDGEHQYEWE
jgi:hypothetical protein